MAALASDWLRHFRHPEETAERNSTKLDRKQDLDFLYLVVFFRPIWKARWPPWPLICWGILTLKLLQRNVMHFYRKQDLNVLYQVCVFGTIRKTRWPPYLWLTETFSTFNSKTVEQISIKLDRKQDLNALFKGCIFGRSEKNMAALASDSLTQFRFLLWNCRAEFS